MNTKLLVVLLIQSFLLLAKVFGQSCGTTGGFEILPSEGCAPLSVKVKNQIPKANSLSYVYHFDRQQTTPPNKEDVLTDSSYVYQSPGTYTILQFGSSEGTGFSLCKDVVVYETRAPKADLISCQDGKVRLTLLPDSISKAYDQIEINWGDASPVTVWKKGESINIDHKYPSNAAIAPVTIRGKYNNGMCSTSLNTTTISQPILPPSLQSIQIKSLEISGEGSVKINYEGIQDITTEILIDKGDGKFVSTGKTGNSGGSSTLTIDNLSKSESYRFKLVSKDFCENLIESDVVSSIVLSQNTPLLDEANSLSWKQTSNGPKISSFELLRDGASIFTTSDQLNYLDQNVKCKNVYKYQIVGIFENDVRSYSAPIEITPTSSAPETIESAYVTVEKNNLIKTSVELTGKGLTSSYDLIIERSNNGSSDFQKISPENNESLAYEDHDVDTPIHSYCYRFSYKNACGQSSPSFSRPVCSIWLKNFSQELVWSTSSPFDDPVTSYDLIEMDAAGNIINEIQKELLNKHVLGLDDQSVFSLQIRAYDGERKRTSYSNVLNLDRAAVLLIPDAFTPNGDGINDLFDIKSYYTTSFSMKIFNRWGEVVFTSDKVSDSWNGNINGKPAPQGYYIFNITTTGGAKQPVTKNGSILLIR